MPNGERPVPTPKVPGGIPNLNIGQIGRQLGDPRLLHGIDPFMLLQAVKLDAHRSGALDVPIYEYVSEIVCGAGAFVLDVGPPAEESWRVLAVSGCVYDAAHGARRPLPIATCGLTLYQLRESPNGVNAGAGARAAPATTGFYSPAIGRPADGAGGAAHWWTYEGSLFMRPPMQLLWEGVGTAAGDIAQLAVTYGVLPEGGIPPR